MTHFEHYKSGRVFGIRYRFDVRGDGIPKHAHGPALAHNIVVVRGSILLVMDESRICSAGVHDFDWAAPHEIVAMEDDSETLHLFLNGQPEGYDVLPPNELHGTLQYIEDSQ